MHFNYKALAKRKKHCRGNIRDFQCLLKWFPVSHIWKHLLLLQKQKLLPGKQKYFLPNSEIFETHRFPTLVRAQYNIPHTVRVQYNIPKQTLIES